MSQAVFAQHLAFSAVPVHCRCRRGVRHARTHEGTYARLGLVRLPLGYAADCGARFIHVRLSLARATSKVEQVLVDAKEPGDCGVHLFYLADVVGGYGRRKRPRSL